MKWDEPASGWNDNQKSETWMIVLGILLIIAGVIALFSVVITTLASITFLGILLIISGIVQIILAFKKKESIIYNIIIGILYLFLGIITISHPVISLLSITLFFGIYFISIGIARIIIAFAVETENKGWILWEF